MPGSARSAPFLSALVGVVFASGAAAQLQCTQVSTAGPATTDFGAAHDAVRGRTVLFGGTRLGIVRNETHEWNGATWSTFATGTLPGPRVRPALAFDEARGRTVLFGGFSSSGIFLADTWTFQGSAWQQQAASPAPSPRSGAAMAHDRGRQVVVLFGGFVPTGADSAETWEWNGNAWTQRAPGVFPTARGAHRMAYDAGRGRVVLFGGYRTPTGTTQGDTWQWDGSNWSAVATAAVPPSRCDQAMAYDEARGRIVMFGGLAAFQQPGNVPVTLGDCWVLSASGWQAKAVPGLPSTRTYVLGAYDVANREVVLHGGLTSAVTYNQTHRLEPLVAATMQPYGAGCSGSNGTPALAADSRPWIGDYYQVSVTNVPAATLGFLAIGFSNTVWNGQAVPVDLTSLGLPGCQAWLGPDLTASFVVQNGIGSWGLSICNCSFAIGLAYSLQAIVLDAGVARPLGGSMSNALRATIGDW